MSGAICLILVIPIYKYYKFDSFEDNLIIYEQAIYITAKYTDEIREIVEVSEFLEEVKLNKNLDFSKHVKDSKLQESLKMQFVH